MSASVTVMEQVQLLSPLGMRFWDVAAEAPAGGGLQVRAYRQPWAAKTFAAIEGPGGIYSFHALPGLQTVSQGGGDDAFWAANTASLAYVVTVSDPLDRYLPMQLTPLLPWRGLYGVLASPPDVAVPDDTWVPVFSTPSRPAPGPAGAVCAQLMDDANGLPAAWALVTVSTSAGSSTGMCDARGVVSIAVPYPEPRNFAFSSPSAGSVRFIDQVWPIDISVRYRPAVPSAAPDLQDVLQQPAAKVWTDSLHSSPAGSFSLAYDSTLVLRSLDSVSGRALPYLIVTPA
jgi:hypothetical protein